MQSGMVLDSDEVMFLNRVRVVMKVISIDVHLISSLIIVPTLISLDIIFSRTCKRLHVFSLRLVEG
jgi:hypothetical protein